MIIESYTNTLTNNNIMYGCILCLSIPRELPFGSVWVVLISLCPLVCNVVIILSVLAAVILSVFTDVVAGLVVAVVIPVVTNYYASCPSIST